MVVEEEVLLILPTAQPGLVNFPNPAAVAVAPDMAAARAALAVPVVLPQLAVLKVRPLPPEEIARVVVKEVQVLGPAVVAAAPIMAAAAAVAPKDKLAAMEGKVRVPVPAAAPPLDIAPSRLALKYPTVRRAKMVAAPAVMEAGRDM